MTLEGPRGLAHDTVYLTADSAGELLRGLAMVVETVADADEACYLDHILVRRDPDAEWEAILNYAVPGCDEERFLTTERLNQFARDALGRAKEPAASNLDVGGEGAAAGPTT